MNNNTRKYILGALFIALVLVCTMISIPMPYGYVNLGDGVTLTAGFILGPYYGMLAGGFGAAMADLTLGYPQYIIPTLILKGNMGFMAGLASSRSNKTSWFFYFFAGFVMVTGYYLVDSFLHNNFISTLVNLPANIIQYSIGLLICKLIAPRIKKIVGTFL